VQQAESFTSRRHRPEPNQSATLVPREREALVHLEPQKAGDKPHPSTTASATTTTRAKSSTRAKGTRWMVPVMATTLAGAAAMIEGRTEAHLLNPRTTDLQPGHSQRAVPSVVLASRQRHQVLRGNEP
jgi:hypothetical protein